MLRKLCGAYSFLGIVLLLASVPAHAAGAADDAAKARDEIKSTFGFVPDFFIRFPDVALASSWELMKTLQLNEGTKLSAKDKELIGLAVAAQIPCRYCTFAHTEFAKLNGASEQEIREAVAIGALTRHWSTFLNGLQIPEAEFSAQIAKAVAHMKEVGAGKAPAPKEIDVVDRKTAAADIKQHFGQVPPFFWKYPAPAMPAAWRLMRDLEIRKTALPGKIKSLMGIAVASQIPCHYCLIADKNFGKLDGLSDDELHEAIAMSSLVRLLSTVLNGMQINERAFQRDVKRLVAHVKRMRKQKMRTQKMQKTHDMKMHKGKPGAAAEKASSPIPASH